ncbi:MAG: phosphotransferase [Tepidiformaceae bacterium]
MTTDFPRTIAEVTPAWLSQVLGAKVTSYEVAFLEGGVLSDAFKLHSITYDGDQPDAPASVVLKMANQVKDRRDFALMSNAYTRELRFFQDLAKDVPLASPKVYGCFTDGSAGSEFFAIVMEDLSAHSRVFDQVDDPPDEAFARKIALEAAGMHAKFWESETAALPWLGRPDNRYVFALDMMCKMTPQTWAPFRDLWTQMYGHDVFERAEDQPLEELTALLCGPKGAAIHEKIYDILSSRPRTLLHGDMRADNVFRTDPALGKSVEDSDLTFIDWQIIHAGPPGPEFTQAWMHSLEPAVRRKDRDMLRQYHTRLVELNPAAAAYTYEMLLEDYALSFCFWWTAIITIGVGTLPVFAQPEGARMKQLWERGLLRSKVAMLDLDCLARIRTLAESIPDAPPVEAPLPA